MNAQFVERGQRLNEATGAWEMLPTLDGRATVVGAVGLRFKEDTAQVLRVTSGLIVGKILQVQMELPARCTACTQHIPSYSICAVDIWML